MTPVVFRPAAEADLVDAYQWYGLKRSDLGDRFLEAVQAVEQLSSAHPEAYRILQRGVRRAPLRQFPYFLLYRIYPDVIAVIGCFHASRAPRVWRSRFALHDG